jgi:uncharacterized delta-60 repeat protein
VALQPDGRIVVAGEDLATRRRFIVARLEPDGKPDLSFNGGHAIVEFGAGTDALARAVAVQKDGRIVAAGSTLNVRDLGGDDQFLAAALQPDGRLIASGFSDAGFISMVIARYLAR